MEFYTIISYIPLIFIALIGLSLLVAIHEFGHFIFAKFFGIYIPSFSIGFGPQILTKKIGETTFCISAIPLGGYVEIAGSAELGQGDQDFAHIDKTDGRSLESKPYWQKMLIMFGGILFNFILAFFILIGLYYSGAPCIGNLCSTDQPIVKAITPNSNAQKAGLETGDTVLAINNIKTTNIKDFSDQANQLVDQDTSITILRNGKEKKLNIQIGSQEISGKKLSKIGIEWLPKPRTFLESIHDSFKTELSMSGQIFIAIKNLIFGGVGRDQMGGPVLLIYQITHSLNQGFKIFLFILAVISINLAVFNLLPLPIFDGGQALFYTIEAIMGRNLSAETKYKIHYYTWLLLIVLIAVLTFSDIKKLIQLPK